MAKRKVNIDYVKLRHAAYEMVVINGQTQKYASEMLSVSEQSLSQWAIEGNWRDERKARQNMNTTSRANILRILSLLSNRRLALECEIAIAAEDEDESLELALRKEAWGISDEMSKLNKSLLSFDKDNRVTLGIYIEVMEDVFENVRRENEELFFQLIEFQKALIRKKTSELS